jgi:hypothetical protein
MLSGGPIDGVIEEDERDTRTGYNTDPHEQIRQLQAELVSAKRVIRDLEQEARAARQEVGHALGSLRLQLGPLYRALQQVFGELDAAGMLDGNAGQPPRASAALDAWKSKLGLGPSKVIDALLLHGEMNTQQLAVATGYNRNTVPQYISACSRVGLIVKNGRNYALKKL